MSFSKPAAAVAWTIRLAAFCAVAGPAVDATANWVRGRGGVNSTGTVDALTVATPPQPLVPTIRTAGFNDGQKGFFSQADMGAGALRGRAYVSGGSGSANYNPVLGETITFNNTTGETSSWDFSYAVDGTVTTGTTPFPIEQDFGPAGTFRTTFLQFAFHVFPGNTVGPIGSSNSWLDQVDSALFTQVKDVAGFPTSGDLQSYNAFLEDSITGSILLEPGVNTFDVVMVLSGSGSIPATIDSSFDIDFTNTGQLTIDSALPFTSASGYLLTGQNIVPEPAAAGLAGIMMGLLIAQRRRA